MEYFIFLREVFIEFQDRRDISTSIGVCFVQQLHAYGRIEDQKDSSFVIRTS